MATAKATQTETPTQAEIEAAKAEEVKAAIRLTNKAKTLAARLIKNRSLGVAIDTADTNSLTGTTDSSPAEWARTSQVLNALATMVDAALVPEPDPDDDGA